MLAFLLDNQEKRLQGTSEFYQHFVKSEREFLCTKDDNSLGGEKHVLARVNLVSFRMRPAQVLRDGLGGEFCLAHVTKVTG